MLTIIDRTVRLKAPSVGNVEEDVYRLSRDDHMNCIYTKVGVSNVNDYINSFKDSSSLASILNRIQYLPVRDKIRYLNMENSGSGADMSIFPKDPTELYLVMKKYEKFLPTISSELNSGKSLDCIISAIFNNKEVKSDGQTESGNDGSVEV